MNKTISYATVFFQFLFAGLIIIDGTILAKNWLWLSVELVGIALGGWAIFTMRIGNFNVTPDVKTHGRFVERGPYRFIRHPMYSAVLLTTLALVADQPNFYRFGLWALLLFTLLIKLTHEEKLLTRHFSEYTGYQSRTKRLVPFVF